MKISEMVHVPFEICFIRSGAYSMIERMTLPRTSNTYIIYLVVIHTNVYHEGIMLDVVLVVEPLLACPKRMFTRDAVTLIHPDSINVFM